MALTDAPFLISNSAVFKFSYIAARSSGVSLSLVRALTDAPFSISNSAVFEFSPLGAQCSGV
jgi:hypothetical protein